MDKCSNKTDNSSSKYFDACSNSKELNEINEDMKEKKINIKNMEINQEYEIKNIYESPNRIPNSNINSITNNKTKSNMPSNFDKNMFISTKDKTNDETGKTKLKERIRKKINIYAMNSVKKNLMSPIEENNQFDFSDINSNEKLNPKLNNINEITNNNNNNININIIINKNKKLQKEIKHNIQDKNSIKNKNAKSKKKEKIITTNINEENISLYSSYSNSLISKKIPNNVSNKQNIKNNKNLEFSYMDLNTNKIFGNSGSDSMFQNGLKINNNPLMIHSIEFKNLAKDILNVDDLQMKYNLRDIPIQRKDEQKNRYIQKLIELQIFNFGDSPIWVIKLSHHGKYLAAGNKAGKIRIYELMGYDYDKYEKIYDNKNIINYLYFINEKPIKELTEHKKDITDLSWSPFKCDLLLSCSIDNFVILWDISNDKNCLIKKIEHDDYVTCVQFSPINDNIFVTGCFDKYVRIYDINKINIKENKEFAKTTTLNFGLLNLSDKITSLSFYPDGSQIAIGTINGKIHVYDLMDNTGRYNTNFNCRNRVGKNSLGKKVTSINFLNKKNAIISTCDSCVRLLSMKEGKNLSKYKGYVNENSMIRADIDFSNDVIITGSENGYCYTWKILAEDENYLKNYNYESFKPFERDIVECSIVVNEKCFVNYMKKVLFFTNKINIISIFINSTDNGKIEVLLNINEEIY